MLFSTVAAPTYIQTNKCMGFLFWKVKKKIHLSSIHLIIVQKKMQNRCKKMPTPKSGLMCSEIFYICQKSHYFNGEE